MRIGIIGSGIAGLAASWLLSREHEVVLFEANDYLGGHTHTHDISDAQGDYAIDTGFIVHNRQNYPLLTRMFEELGVATKPTTMSFSVCNEATGLEYNAATIDTLFCQRRNILSFRFLSMLRDIARFYRLAPALLTQDGDGPTLENYLALHCFSDTFRDDHLVPMASALWSSPPSDILKIPMGYLVRFMANHHMLSLGSRPQWRIVEGGSRRYVEALRAHWCVDERPNSPVVGVTRETGRVEVRTPNGTEYFDQLVIACHSDQALALLTDADAREREILGALTYQANDTVLHTDTSLLPRSQKAWAAWNVTVQKDRAQGCTVSYCMNLLQGISAPQTFIVTLNRTHAIDPSKILRRMSYHHPVYTHVSVAAQKRRGEIQGRRRTWFAGAYWGWGFHEDGMRSAVDVAAALGTHWKEKAPARSSALDLQWMPA